MMDCRNTLADSLLLGILIFGQVMCYPKGAPDIACSSMMPNHGVNASKTFAPYTITISKSTYRPNEKITVTLQANSGVNFKGFLIQPRKNSSISQPNTVGSLTGDSTQNSCTGMEVAQWQVYWTCEQKGPNLNNTIESDCIGYCAVPFGKELCSNYFASLTQTNGNLKTTVNVTWKAPAVAADTVVFLATFVQTKATYWVNVRSRELIPDSSVPVTNSSGGGGGDGGGGVITASSDSDGKVTRGSSGGGGVTQASTGGGSTVSYGASLTYSLMWFLLLV